MTKLKQLDQLRSAALPFVTRALRGPRLRRVGVLALLLALLTPILGIWLAFGSGSFEREIRVAFDLEESRWRREFKEYVIITDSREEAAMVQAEIHRIPTVDDDDYGWSRARGTQREAITFVFQATLVETPSRALEGSALRERALETLGRHGLMPATTEEDRHSAYFNWHDPDHLQRLRSILDADLLPRVERYASALTTVDALRITGTIAGGIVAFLLLVLGPLLVGTQIAQEVHENTLMPLTGTSLRTRELILGLAAGALASVGIVALPQALLFLVVVIAAGSIVPALAGLLVALVGCFFLSILALLLGYALGNQRTPGVLGISLLTLFGILALIGAAFGLAPHAQTIGLFALLPEAATAHLLRTSLLPHELFLSNPDAGLQADLAIGVGTVGIALLGLLGLRALERRLGRSASSALNRREALLGAIVTTALVMIANPARTALYTPPEAFYLLSLGLLALPFAILLMLRAPVVGPEARRPLALPSLLGELALWAGIHAILTLIVVGRFSLLLEIHPAAVAYLAWFLLTLGLLALRVIARPMGIGARLWVAFSALFAMLAFPQIAVFLRSRPHDAGELLLLGQVSPFLGFLQAALLLAIPWSLWRALRR